MSLVPVRLIMNEPTDQLSNWNYLDSPEDLNVRYCNLDTKVRPLGHDLLK